TKTHSPNDRCSYRRYPNVGVGGHRPGGSNAAGRVAKATFATSDVPKVAFATRGIWAEVA
ncbi:hypothetical protein ABT256_38385, partial [Amycolatopsis japonica]|uniref:hypothetical protein n=1 Tax=Amycolatopsis japonica TaxID=208439 RepID=UPI003325934B